jgi:hypothetical protein
MPLYVVPIVRGNSYLTKADDPTSALLNFYGRNKQVTQGYEYDYHLPIIEIRDCGRLFQNSAGTYVCGEALNEYSMVGEFGYCLFEGHVPPPDCPIIPILDEIKRPKLGSIRKVGGLLVAAPDT